MRKHEKTELPLSDIFVTYVGDSGRDGKDYDL